MPIKVNPEALQRMLQVLSPVRPKALRMGSTLGDVATTLRGGTQPVGQLLNQLRGKPGVKSGAMSQVFGHLSDETRLSPLELAGQARNPKFFAQRGISGGNEVNYEALNEAADDLIYGPIFASRREAILRQMLREDLSAFPEAAKYLAQPVWSSEDISKITNFVDRNGKYPVAEVYQEELADDAMEMVEETYSGSKSMTPGYSDYQRQPGMASYSGPRETARETPYFETVLRGTPSRGATIGLPNKDTAEYTDPRIFHFDNPSQLGHVRGSVTPTGNVFAEELQADQLKWLNKYGEQEGVVMPPELEGIYGKLGRMLIDRSAEAGASGVAFPDANRIASVRDSSKLPFFQDVYDKRLAKELYEPLAKRGVPLRQENGWTTMELPEGVLEAIRTRGLLNYRRGGRVR